MKYNRLGTAGLQVSALSFGSWVTFGKQVDTDRAMQLMTTAYDQGVNFFDNAEVYEYGVAEDIMGSVLARCGWRRDSYSVSSKVFWGGDLPTQRGLSKKHVHDACHAALRRLRVDYLDLYFCHRPDPDTPILETVFAMNDLILQGKILYWGTSEWKPNQLIEAYKCAQKYGLRGPTMEQPEYNLFNRTNVEIDLKPVIDKYGLGTTTWSPLCSGILTGKYQSGIPKGSRFDLPGYEWLKRRYDSDVGQERLKKVEQFKILLADYDCTLSQASIAWCLQNNDVSTVILGASQVDQLTENLKALTCLTDVKSTFWADVNALFV
ncbi:aldo/keto reductase [Candidatus Marinamargulisbacteria bacterium SCGC AG-414-C22]|nr:aldo/keto reductase [Candidatus Marinamargulisbacteria bacterium SCGC AG-414-C22]